MGYTKNLLLIVILTSLLAFTGCPGSSSKKTTTTPNTSTPTDCDGQTIKPDLTLELSVPAEPVAGEEAPVYMRINVPEPDELECAKDEVLTVDRATYTGLEMERSPDAMNWELVVFQTVSGEKQLLRLATPAPIDCLEPVDTASVTFSLPFDEPGFYRITAYADLDNDVAERDESNNTAVVMVEVEE